MTSTPTLEIGARDLIALVDAVVPFAGTDRGLPVLNAVRIESTGTHLLAMATDRFRIGMKRLAAPEGTQWPEFNVTVPLAAIRSIKSMFRPERGMDSSLVLTVDTAKDRLDVEAGGALIDMLSARASYGLEVGEFPKFRKLFRDALDREDEAVPFAVNAKFLAAYAAGVSAWNPSLSIKPSATKPIFITDGEDFVSILMPRKSLGAESGQAFPNMDSWSTLFSDAPAKPVKAVRKTAKKAVA